MIALLFSILASTVILIVFKLFERFHINNFQAIVVNYYVAGSCGILIQGNYNILYQWPQFSWFTYALMLGSLFIIIFFLIALTTQKSGLSVVSIATKMSVVIPVAFGLFYYGEQLGILKGIGILTALAAVYLSSIKNKAGLVIKRSNLVLPLLVFLGSGIIDTGIKFLEEGFVAESDVAIFSSTLFLSAGFMGSLVLIFKKITGTLRFETKSLVGGLMLGIPNFFTVYFLVMALRSDLFESSGIFVINHIGVVTFSTVAGIFLFKEKLILKNWMGFVLALISILLITLSKA